MNACRLRTMAIAVLAILSGCHAEGPLPTGLPPADTVRHWSSSADGSRRLAPGAPLPILPARAIAAQSADRATVDVLVDPDTRFQSMVGFGAAMTDASAILIEQALPPAKRDALLRDLFGPEGLSINFVRVPIGASDFSPEHYSLDDMPKGRSDPRLQHFTMAGPDKAQVPALQAARRINPKLTLVASPWSAPGWMKTTDSLIKGHLRPEYYDAFASYIGRYVSEMKARDLPVEWLTIQNEPDFEPEDYPGMKVTAAERAAIIGSHLGPLLARQSQPTKILDWDHNWDQPENPLSVLRDKTANRYVAGVAWHCYAGEVSAMEQVRAAYPDKDVFFTECSGGQWAPDWGSTLAWMTDNLVIAPSRSGSRGTLLWNLALDRDYGPHKGGCGDCRGVCDD